MGTYRAAERIPTEPWSVVDDPVAWRRFVAEVIDRHHRVVRPGAVADLCSCGRPFMLCSIAPLAEPLVAQHHGL
ncbi:MAG: hypothetical protein ACRDTM_06200 [Micromonosporaceae bacterium]